MKKTSVGVLVVSGVVGGAYALYKTLMKRSSRSYRNSKKMDIEE